jgi:aspartate aminotransferase
MATIQGQSTTNASSISQQAAIAALNGPQEEVTRMNESFRQRHDFFVAGLNALPGICCRPGAGTFYAFADVSGAMYQLGLADDTAFCEFLLNEALVAGVPGSGFGAPGHLRLSFATSMANLTNALERIARALAKGPARAA